MNRHLWLLTLCQGLFLTNNVTFIAINGLVGLSMAPLGWMATLPVMAYVVGGALSTGLVAKTQARFGRKASFQLGLLVVLLACLLCAYAAVTQNFWLLCSATLVAGYYNANANLYRFAAAELAAPAWREKAVSLVLAGGLIGAVIGPNLAQQTRSLMSVPFAGAYITLSLVAVLAMVLLAFIDFPPLTTKKSAGAGRPLGQIMKQPTFIIAALTSALGYGTMNLLMAATPLAMQQHNFAFSDAALVLQWHVIGMFAPGFFTGHLIKRFGTLTIMSLGLLLNSLCIAVALSGVDRQQFLLALFLLGVGWNFLFTGATTLLATAHDPHERVRAQAANDFIVFGTVAVTSFSAGALHAASGWAAINWAVVPAVLVAAALVLWHRVHQAPRPALAD